MLSKLSKFPAFTCYLQENLFLYSQLSSFSFPCISLLLTGNFISICLTLAIFLPITSDINIAQPVGRSKTFECKKRGRGTLGEIAKKAGVSHMTAFQYDKIQQQGTEEQKANAKRLKKRKTNAQRIFCRNV